MFFNSGKNTQGDKSGARRGKVREREGANRERRRET